MFFSKHIPVNLNRTSAAIYTPKAVYPVDLLVQAEAALSCGYGVNKNVIIEDGIVSFPQKENIRWSIPDVYIASTVFHTGKENDFSFYMVTSDNKHPQLFVSKAFKKHRLLVNAHTFESIIVTRPELVKRVASLIDHNYTFQFCMDFFETVKAIESGNGKFLDAIIVDRGTEDESLVVSPIKSLYANDNIYYSIDVLDDYFRLLLDPTTEVESAMIVGDTIARKNVVGYVPITCLYANELVTTYQKLSEGKCNYTTLCDESCETQYFVSTNYRYLVNARTFEQRVIKNMNMRQQLIDFATVGKAPLQALEQCWQLAGVSEEN